MTLGAGDGLTLTVAGERGLQEKLLQHDKLLRQRPIVGPAAFENLLQRTTQLRSAESIKRPRGTKDRNEGAAVRQTVRSFHLP